MSDFRSKLAQTSGSGGSSKRLKKINMQDKRNQGTIFFVPMSPVDGTDPVAVLENVAEVKDHYTWKDKDNVEQKGQRWLMLLSKEDYPEMDMDDVEVYKSFKAKFKQLNNHKYDKDEKKNRELKKGIIRFKNYILMFGWVIEHKDLSGKIVNKNTFALLIFASNNFKTAFNKALDAKDKTLGGTEWMVRLFNREVNNRKQFLNISYKLSDDKKTIGYIASVSIEKFDEETIRLTNGKTDGLDIPASEEDIATLTNPVRVFLGLAPQEGYFSDRTQLRLTIRLNKQLNRYCGTDLEIPEEPTKEESTSSDENKDKDIPEVKRDLPKEDAPKKNVKDIWDDEGGDSSSENENDPDGEGGASEEGDPGEE